MQKLAPAAHTRRNISSNLLFDEPDKGEEKDSVALSKGQIDEWLKIFGEKK